MLVLVSVELALELLMHGYIEGSTTYYARERNTLWLSVICRDRQLAYFTNNYIPTHEHPQWHQLQHLFSSCFLTLITQIDLIQNSASV